MTRTKKPDVIVSNEIDWSDLDDAIATQMTIPENAITATKIRERYKVSDSSARRMMRDLALKGYISGTARIGGHNVSYLIKESK